MATIKKHDPKDYANLEKPENAAKLKQIEATAKKTAEEELKLALQQNISEPEELAKHLSQERIKMIQEGLTIPTYVLTIRREGDNSFVDITRNGEKFMPSMMLASKKDIEQITPLQIASIVIESILFLAQAIGIHVALSAGTLQRLANEVSQAVQRSAALLSAVAKLRTAMQGGSHFAQARGVFGVITASYSAGVLWTVIKEHLRTCLVGIG